MVSIARQSFLLCALMVGALAGCASGNSTPAGQVDATAADATVDADASASSENEEEASSETDDMLETR